MVTEVGSGGLPMAPVHVLEGLKTAKRLGAQGLPGRVYLLVRYVDLHRRTQLPYLSECLD